VVRASRAFPATRAAFSARTGYLRRVAAQDPSGWAAQGSSGQVVPGGTAPEGGTWGEMPWPEPPEGGVGTGSSVPTGNGVPSNGADTYQAGNSGAGTYQAGNYGAGTYGPGTSGPSSNGRGTGPVGRARPGRIPARAALVAVPGALAGIVLAGVGAAIGQGITGSATSGLSDLLGEAGLWVAMLATVVFVSHRFGTASLQRDYGLGIKAKDPLWGLCAAVVAFLGAGLVLEVFSGTKFSGSNDQIITQQKGHEAGIVLVTLIVALGAPFFEELFFRGFLRTALQARFGRHGAVWLQAVFFGLAHAGEASTALGNVSVVLAMFTVGVVLGYTAMLTGRLGAGMVAHCLFNLVAVASVV
jgi:uncharacterized protein